VSAGVWVPLLGVAVFAALNDVVIRAHVLILL
jgi:hypothetical protein